MWTRRQFVAASAATALARPIFAQAKLIPFIDSHVHVWKHDPAFPFAAGAHPSPENATVEMLLDLMHANDVARTVIIQVIHYKWDNSYLASVLKRYPRHVPGGVPGESRGPGCAGPAEPADGGPGLSRGAAEPRSRRGGRLDSRAADAAAMAPLRPTEGANDAVDPGDAPARGASSAGRQP